MSTSSAPAAAAKTPSTTASPSIADAYPDYEQVGPAWVGKPTKNHIFAGKRFILLFGWLDAQFKYVEKYAQYYRANGYTAIIQLSTTKDWNNLWYGREEFAEFDPLIAYLEEHKLVEPTSSKTQSTHPKVIVQAFSNGGVGRMRLTANALHVKGLQIKSQAVILDSAPSKATMSSGAGYVESLTSPAFLKPIAYGAAYVAAAICSPFMDLKKHPISRGAPYALSVKNEQGNVYGPRLFIYSEADKLIPIKDLRENIQLAKDEGLVVEEKVFTTSAHVKHAVDFKDEYWATVESFLKKHVN